MKPQVIYRKSEIGTTWVQTGIKTVYDEWGNETDIPVGVVVKDPRLIVADNFQSIDKHCCRICHKYMKPYGGVYYKDEISYGTRVIWQMDYNNNYCEPCAKKLAAKGSVGKIDRRPEVTYCRAGGSAITYVSSKGWYGDPSKDPDALIFETR